MNSIELAKKELIDNDKKLVVVKNDEIIFTSEKNGIVPMYDLYNEKLTGDIFIADRFIGGGALKLLLNMDFKIKKIFTFVISENALKELQSLNIEVIYDTIVEKILNRKGDDYCPVEKISMQNNKFIDFYNELESFLKITKQI